VLKLRTLIAYTLKGKKTLALPPLGSPSIFSHKASLTGAVCTARGPSSTAVRLQRLSGVGREATLQPLDGLYTVKWSL
jgi:hypothetical protein